MTSTENVVIILLSLILIIQLESVHVGYVHYGCHSIILFVFSIEKSRLDLVCVTLDTNKRLPLERHAEVDYYEEKSY